MNSYPPPLSLDAHRALELLEEYKKHLSGPESKELVEALDKAIVAIRSRLFQALLGKECTVMSYSTASFVDVLCL